MRTAHILGSVALWLQAAAMLAPSQNGGLAVIANKSNQLDSLSHSQVQAIFLRKISRWPWGAAILPVDLPDGSGSRVEFAGDLLHISPEQLSLYWIDRKVTANIDPPVKAASPSHVKALVASNKGAIGYIPAEWVDDSVKVLKVR